jgi:SAM-dependent methyltransferase
MCSCSRSNGSVRRRPYFDAAETNILRKALELGCRTGTNSVWLAQQGFEVTGANLAPLAVEQAERRAQPAGVKARFVVADVLNLPGLDGPFAFFFGRGCYHAVRRDAPQQYAPAAARQMAPGGRGLRCARPRTQVATMTVIASFVRIRKVMQINERTNYLLPAGAVRDLTHFTVARPLS